MSSWSAQSVTDLVQERPQSWQVLSRLAAVGIGGGAGALGGLAVTVDAWPVPLLLLAIVTGLTASWSP